MIVLTEWMTYREREVWTVRSTWLAGIFLLSLAPSIGWSQDADTVLVGLARHFDASVKRLSCEFEAVQFEQGGDLGPAPVQSSMIRGSVSARDNEYRIRTRERSRIWLGGSFRNTDLELERLVSSELRAQFQNRHPVDDANFDLSSFAITGEQVHASAISVDENMKLISISMPYGVLTGQLLNDNDLDVVSILRADPRLQVAQEMVDGVSVVRLTGKSRNGTHSVWVDTNKGYAPIRMEYVKTGQDLYCTVPVSSYPPFTNPADRYPSTQLTEARFEVNTSQLVSVGEHWFPSEIETREITRYEQDQYFQLTSKIKFDRLRLACDDNDLKPAMSIPDGTRVYLPDSPKIQAEWRQGKLVKVVDLAALEQFDQVTGVTSNRHRYSLMIFAFIVIGAIAASFILRRHRTSS